MTKYRNLKYLTEVLGQNGLKDLTFTTLIDRILQKGHYSYQKDHLTKMAANINGTSQKWHLTKTASHKNSISKLLLLVFSSTTNTLLIKPTHTFIQKLEKLCLKIP